MNRTRAAGYLRPSARRARNPQDFGESKRFGLDVPAGEADFLVVGNQVRRRKLSREFARLAGQEGDVVVIPEQRQSFRTRAFVPNLHMQLECELVAGIVNTDANPPAVGFLSVSELGVELAGARQRLKRREVLVRL